VTGAEILARDGPGGEGYRHGRQEHRLHGARSDAVASLRLGSEAADRPIGHRRGDEDQCEEGSEKREALAEKIMPAREFARAAPKSK